MPVFITIFSGVMVFVIGQILIKIFIDPVVKLRGTIGEVAYVLSTFSHVAHNAATSSEDVVAEVFMEFRQLAARLRSDYQQIPAYSNIARIFSLPGKENIQNASKNIVRISNLMTSGGEIQMETVMLNYQRTFECLCLEMPEDEKVDEKLLSELIRLHYEKP